MNSPLHSGSLSSSRVRHEFPATGILATAKIKEPDAVRRRLALRKVDRELSKGNYKTALTLVKQLQGKPGGLRGFGAAKQVPRRISSLDQLKLSGIGTSSLKYVFDSILDSIKSSLEFQLSEEVSLLDPEGLAHGGSYESFSEDHLMCMQHEAGHFLVGYLLGALPKRYVLFHTEALTQEQFVGGSVEFLGFEFLREINKGKISATSVCKAPKTCSSKVQISIVPQLQGWPPSQTDTTFSSKTLNRFSCVILGGLVAEHLVFGYSEGLHGDVEKLNRVLQWMGLEESEVDFQLKWATINTLLILVRHQEARSRLAETMALGKSVGSCIDVIENTLNDNEL